MEVQLNSETVFLTSANDLSDDYVVSEKVRCLATGIYDEFQNMIKNYDDNVVKSLMPLVVSILEGLDQVYLEKQEFEVEVELLREDNVQLINQYEIEKKLRRELEENNLELDDMLAEKQKEFDSKQESLEASIRRLELKVKNSCDHISRLEEKEAQSKLDYTKLHERYNEIFKAHMDYVDKTKIFLNSERLNEISSLQQMKSHPLSAKINTDSSSTDGESKPSQSTQDFPNNSVNDKNLDITSLHSEIVKLITQSSTINKSNKNTHDVTLSKKSKKESEVNMLISSDVLLSGEDLPSSADTDSDECNRFKISSISQSLNFGPGTSSDIEDLDRAVNVNFFGMSKEIESLINENTELLTTKNALNIVKDDLISQVDELTNEIELIKEENCLLEKTKESCLIKITELEKELRMVKEEIVKLKLESEEELPSGQRKRFTRMEMTRILNEKNLYKEKLLELQEAVKWTEVMRASKEHPDIMGPKNKSSVKEFFANLFTSSKVSDKNSPKKKNQVV